jgi:hypothetical protein
VDAVRVLTAAVLFPAMTPRIDVVEEMDPVAVTAPVILRPWANVTGPAKLDVPVPFTAALPTVTTSPKLVMIGITFYREFFQLKLA